MSDKKQAKEIAALKARVAELERAAKPPEPAAPFKPMTDAEWRDQMHQMRERNASVIPPWLREACAGGVTDADCADIVRASHRPTGRPGMIPEQPSNVRGGNVAGSGTGWVHETPLGPPPGIRYVDQQLDAQDARDRAERLQQAAQIETARRFAEASAKVDQAIERTRKLMESKP
jgi:hypothetical protein